MKHKKISIIKEWFKLFWFCMHKCNQDEPCKRKIRFIKFGFCEGCLEEALWHVWGVDKFEQTDRIKDKREEE